MTTNFRYNQLQKKTLAGAGVSVGDSSMTLTNFLSIDGVPLTMADFGGVEGFGTCEPSSRGQEEQIRFTGITQNLDGTATLTGISSVAFIAPPTVLTPNFQKSHAGGTSFIITNTAGFYDSFANKKNDEDITGVTWLIDDPVVARQIANKEYVDNAVIGGGVPATDTNPGISMEATQPEVDAGTQSRTYMGTPYELFVNPAKLRARQYNSYVADTGSANLYAITVPNATPSLTDGDEFTFLVDNTNTGASTLAVNGLTPAPIFKGVGTALSPGDLLADTIAQVVYHGASFQLVATSNPNIYGTQFTVNTIDTVTDYETRQLALPTTTTTNGWTVTQATTTPTAMGIMYDPNPGSMILEIPFSYSNIATAFKFNQTKIVRIKFKVAVEPGNTNTNAIAFGLADSGTTNFPDPTSIDRAIKFVYKNVGGTDTLYTVTANNTTNTNNSSTSVTLTNNNIYEIIWIPGTSVKFYANGSLLSTHTTNIPASADDVYIKWVSDNNNSSFFLTDITVSIQS